MADGFLLLPTSILHKEAVAEIIKQNEITAPYGLSLSLNEARELVLTRAEALRRNGRIEFGGGVIEKLIAEFCDSPFLSRHNYAETLNELTEAFYYFKNEALDGISDDELISLMKKYFDQSCQGSIELLQGRELENLALNIRFGLQDYADLYGDEDEYPDGEDEDE